VKKSVEVLILGAGMSGLAAAYSLRDADLLVVDEAPWIGGRMLSARLQPNGPWGNLGAQMITPERVTVVGLAEATGCELLSVKWAHVLERTRLAFEGLGLNDKAQAQLQASIARLEAEQANPRDPTSPDLDGVSLAEWLGDVDEGVAAFWESWSQGLANASIIEISLYAALCLWGTQRLTAWSTDEVPTHGRGDCIVMGGTGELGLALGKALDDRVLTRMRVQSVRPEGGGYAAVLRGPDGEAEIKAKSIVCSLPAPCALEVMDWLPDWKKTALASIKYGHFIVTPIWVSRDGAHSSWTPTAYSRPAQTYALPAFPLRTPGEVDEVGACYQSWVNDRHARQIWSDDDESIQVGVRKAFLRRFPEYVDRIEAIGVQRWRYGLPKFAPGRMQALEQLQASVDNVHFCGDYMQVPNLEGAALTGQRAAAEVKAELANLFQR